jgi:GNAT superfamily N-acetyltransferase
VDAQLIRVRPAAAHDLAELLQLVAEYCAADGHQFDQLVATEGLTPLLEDDGNVYGVVLIAEVADEPVGYAVLTWGWSIEIGGREAVLDELYVRVRGRGIGSELLRVADVTCRDHGVLRMFLETEAPNESARRLYTRHGFETETSIWMSKLL